jgi:branched-chain amino acid aminotransferase
VTTPVLVHTGTGIVPAAEAAVPILDHGFLYGDSVYEVVRTSRGRPFMLAEHLDRLRRSAALIYFALPWSDAEIERRLCELRDALGVPDAYVRIVATRGPGPLSLLPDGCDRPGLYLIGRDLIRYPDRLYAEGCRVAVVRRLRNDPRALDPRAKTGNYLNNMLGLVEARRLGADDAIFLNADLHVTEATTSNVWIVERGRVLTPPLGEGLLQGITRGWILERLPAEGIPVDEAVFGRDRMAAADEVFLSGTVKGIMPVTRVDDAAVADGRPGPVTRRAAALYYEALARGSR